MIQCFHIGCLNGYIIGAISKSFNLNDRYLPDCIRRILIHNPSIILVICVAVVIIYRPFFSHISGSLIFYRNGYCSRVVVCQRDDIKTCSGKGKACFRCIGFGTCRGIHGYLVCGSHTELGKTCIVAVIAVNIIRINVTEAGVTWTILILNCSFLFGSVYGPSAGGITLRNVLRIIIGYEAILIVDGGCRNHGNRTVIITCILTASIVHSVGELIHTVHLHICRSVTYHTVFGYGRIQHYFCLSVRSCKLSSCKCCVCITVCSTICFFCTDIFQFAFIIEHIVLQYMDIYRQTVIDDYRIRNCFHGICHCKPYYGMCIIITVFICF